MKYAEISKETFDLLYKSRASLNNSPLKPVIRTLAELRVSQINGCAYCCELHSNEARKLGIPQAKLDALPGWHNSSSFTDEERVVLQWVESVTCLDGDSQEAKEAVLNIYSERELVDLTACIGIMNALNRIAITLH